MPNKSNDSNLSNTADEQLIALIHKYFPPDQWDNAYRVATAESNRNPAAVGDNYPINGQTIPSYGYFQIRGLPGRPDANTLLNPEQNVAYAADLYKQQGWSPWSTASQPGVIQPYNGPQVSSYTMHPGQNYSGGSSSPIQQYATPGPSAQSIPGQNTYTVKPGDTLWGIAQQYLGNGANWKSLGGYSGDPTKLPVGTKITY